MLGKLSELQNLDLLAGCFYEQRAWSYVSVPHKLYMLQVRVYRRSDPDGQPLQQLETASLTLPEPTCPESSTSPLLLLWASLAACACYETGSVACIIATFPRAIQVRVSLPKTHNTQAGPAQDLSQSFALRGQLEPGVLCTKLQNLARRQAQSRQDAVPATPQSAVTSGG